MGSLVGYIALHDRTTGIIHVRDRDGHCYITVSNRLARAGGMWCWHGVMTELVREGFGS